jgi:hypothetical protein
MEAAKRFFKGRKNGGELGLGELWMSGAFAGTVNTVVANPVEHIRISMSIPTYLTFEAVLINRTTNPTNTSNLRRPIGLCCKAIRKRRIIASLQSAGTMYAT